MWETGLYLEPPLTLNPTSEQEVCSGLVAGHVFYLGGLRSSLSRTHLRSLWPPWPSLFKWATEDKLGLDKHCGSAFLMQVARLLPLRAGALGR